MEIHVPSKHPVMTVREAVVHLTIVTIGIVIALSFEGVRQFVEHRQLAAEARENMVAELGRNKADLDRAVETLGPQRRENRRAYDGVINLIDGKPSGVDNINISLTSAALSAAAYSSAQVTGAFAYMDYDEVRRFTELYDAQAAYVRLQERLLAVYTGLAGHMMLGGGANFDKTSRADLEVMKRQLEDIAGTLFNQQQLGKFLSGQYDAVLKQKQKG
jgi:hypothetical protein